MLKRFHPDLQKMRALKIVDCQLRVGGSSSGTRHRLASVIALTSNPWMPAFAGMTKNPGQGETALESDSGSITTVSQYPDIS